MNINLSETNQQFLGKKDLTIITERVDDVALLLGQMVKMGYVEILDKHIPPHWKQKGLSWGWTSVIWLAYILSEGDHRKVSMENYIKGMKNTLGQLSQQEIDPIDFNDDRLGRLLTHFSHKKSWNAIEQDLNKKSIEVYDLETETVRIDATTVSGYHQVVDEGLFQYGHSKDDPNRPQIKIMTGALDPLGMPLSTDVLSGENADDGLYIPVIDRVRHGLGKTGLLFVGDCKMSALTTRSHINHHTHYYLSPLPMTGKMPEQMLEWIDLGIHKNNKNQLDEIIRLDEEGNNKLIAKGYEFSRTIDMVDQVDEDGDKIHPWTERVLVILSPSYAEKQAIGLEKRLKTACEKIEALTPARGKGKRQITNEEQMTDSIKKVLKSQRVDGLLQITHSKQIEQQKKYVGKGRGSPERETRVIEKVRYQITAIKREEKAINTAKARMGWKAFATNTSQKNLSLSDAILNYRNEYRVERIFQRLKSRLGIAPIFVKNNDQITGMSHLLTLGIRVLTLMEFVLNRSLKKDQSTLPNLYPENHKKVTDHPTSERILKVFSNISMTIILDLVGNRIMQNLPILSKTQQEILLRLGLNEYNILGSN